MTRSELQGILHEMVEKKCDEGFERMKDMPICEKFYTDMAKQGWNEQANTFKSIVLYTTILHPEWTDKEIFLEFANNMRKLYKQGMATLQPNRIINIKKIMKKEITREQRIEMARTQTEKVATMKDWRITNKYNRMQRGAARRMMEKGGFAEMTQAEAHAIEAGIPEYVDEVKYDADGNAYVKKERADKEVKIWGYMWNSVWKEIQLTAF